MVIFPNYFLEIRILAWACAALGLLCLAGIINLFHQLRDTQRALAKLTPAQPPGSLEDLARKVANEEIGKAIARARAPQPAGKPAVPPKA